MNILNRMKLSDKQRELGEKLFEIWNNEHFVAGVLAYAKTDAEVLRIEKLTKENPAILPEQITIEALMINEEKQK